MVVYKSVSMHSSSIKWGLNMPAQTSFLHLLDTSLLHHSLMIPHELRHRFFAQAKSLLVGGRILNFHVYKVRLLLGRFDRRRSSPILVGFIISCSSNEARVIHFWVKVLLLDLMLVDNLVGFVLRLMGGDEISLHLIGHLQLQPFIV